MKTEEVRELLPWYAAGGLDAEEAKKVEALLRESPELERELTEWRALESVVAEVGEDEPAFRPELLTDAHRRIDAYEETRTATSEAPTSARRMHKAQAAKPRAAAAATLLERIFAVWDTTPFAARVAVAAQFAVLVALVGVLGAQWSQEAGISTASGGGAQTFDGPRVTVVFQPDRPLGEIQELLEQSGAEIVSGPSAIGAYVLDLGEVDEAQAAFVLDTLRNSETLVRYAAPIDE
jgi:hypothetical protein